MRQSIRYCKNWKENVIVPTVYCFHSNGVRDDIISRIFTEIWCAKYEHYKMFTWIRPNGLRSIRFSHLDQDVYRELKKDVMYEYSSFYVLEIECSAWLF